MTVVGWLKVNKYLPVEAFRSADVDAGPGQELGSGAVQTLTHVFIGDPEHIANNWIHPAHNGSVTDTSERSRQGEPPQLSGHSSFFLERMRDARRGAA